jgi:3-oxoacyl-[acyl-carrier-protein] synthase III
MFQVTFKALEIEQAASVFCRALNLNSRDDITVMVDGCTATVVFPNDKELLDVRAWGSNARACELVESFNDESLA